MHMDNRPIQDFLEFKADDSNEDLPMHFMPSTIGLTQVKQVWQGFLKWGRQKWGRKAKDQAIRAGTRPGINH